ncbi:Nif3-like dinuclear metal center hexameric protein [Desulfotalea psychrophila]|uniref:GTP cyclohydrolase 1 type 2 homolog n=1 Tax=Desulfotalea psychrophila (strain LSv54 / DSM 12343) TaxID=177439 RepID=Q6AQL0_DESPS|nr:Nif3-like dinuclear metal center hexameric protein [Desulfotalea psychrophila]CAG35363.1 conserved hypothetical protein [Desulfotalea psychrophila LSv54]
MSIYIKDILESIEGDAPKSLAESWDNVGLLVGDKERQVKRVLVGLDPTTSLLAEAIELGADTVITHHPVIFHPLSAIDTSTPVGIIIEQALLHKISLIASHTNLDSAASGVSQALAIALGLEKCCPLLPSSEGIEGTGLGCLAEFSTPLLWEDFCDLLLERLSVLSVQVAGSVPKRVARVALCGGSGSGFAEKAYRAGADVYITAEIKHDVARWAEECSFCLVDAGHYATEQFAVSLMANSLRRAAGLSGWNIEVFETVTEKNPFVTVSTDFFR